MNDLTTVVAFVLAAIYIWKPELLDKFARDWLSRREKKDG